jgi:hypothetical protein
MSREHPNKLGPTYPENCSSAYHLKKIKTPKKKLKLKQNTQTKLDKIFPKNSCNKMIFKSHLRIFNKSSPFGIRQRTKI